ncbi:MAG TPA: anti-sigma factor [Pseudonocardiaceae bacterium]|nr:anti-sigma factor [Pseudonocardiaceae bacterium]
MSSEVHTLTGAYALNALDDTERAEFERHLAECPDCEREVAEFRRTANLLGAAVAEQPSDSLRQRVFNEIRTTRQEPPGRPRPVAPRGRGRSGGTSRWPLALTSVAAAVALALAGTFGVAALRAQHELDEAQETLAVAAAEYAPVAQVLGEPDAQSVTATGATGGNATVMMSRKLDKGVFLAFHMPTTPSGKAYQAWAIGAGGYKSLGVLKAGGTDSTVPVIMNTLGGTATIGVTVEPAGGSKQPTTTPVMEISLPT